MKIAGVSFVGVTIVCFSSLLARAQDRTSVGTERPVIVTAPNAIYLEMLGPGLLYSINYERRLTNSVSLRLGFSSWSLTFFSTSSATIVPMTLSWFPLSNIDSDPSSKLEVGAGICYFNSSTSGFLGFQTSVRTAHGIFYTGTLGYRYQAADGGFVFRFAFTPLVAANGTNSSTLFDSGSILPYGGISLGFGF